MALKWEGDELVKKMRRAEIRGVDATMDAAVIRA